MGLPTLLIKGKLKRPDKPNEVPLEYITTWIKKRMPEFGGRNASLKNRILIVKSETGSGKSTALPVAVFRLLRGEKTPPKQAYRGKSVICTQPRILTAKSLAEDVSSKPFNPDIVLGKTVGFQTGAFALKPASGLIYATVGTLRVQLKVLDDAAIMSLYRFILIDEAHERALDTDLTLALLKDFYIRNEGNENLPFLLLTSATIDTDKYARYFSSDLRDHASSDLRGHASSDLRGHANPIDVVEVQGRTYGVTPHWPAVGSNNFIESAAETAVNIHVTNIRDPPEEADILIFVPGMAETNQIVQLLEKRNLEFRVKGSTTPPFLVLAIDGLVVKNQQRDYWRVFRAPSELTVPLADGSGTVRPARRIVVSTNVAETGLTIDTLKYVIDCGWARQVENYPPDDISGLITKPATRSRIEQRKGRAGRLFPGEFYPMYTEKTYKSLVAMQLPDIVTEGPAEIMAELIAAQSVPGDANAQPLPFDVRKIDMLDNPPVVALWSAYERAIVAGVITELRGGASREQSGAAPNGPPHVVITPMGVVAAKTSMTLEEIGFLSAAERHQVSVSDAITIIAFARVGKRDIYAEDMMAQKMAVPRYAEAIRAGLPPAWRATTGGGLDLPPTPAESFYYRVRLAIADEFIEGMLVYWGIAQMLVRSLGDVSAAIEWCEDNGIEFEGAMAVFGEREKIYNELIVAEYLGEDHFRGAHRAYPSLTTIEDVGEFMEKVTQIKRAIYEAWRLKVLTYDERANVYRTQRGREVAVPRQYTDAELSRLRGLGISDPEKPKTIVTNLIKISPGKNRNTINYILKPGLVSVLDGFVPVDYKFLEPRQIE